MRQKYDSESCAVEYSQTRIGSQPKILPLSGRL